MNLQSLWRTWDEFWFRPTDPTTLGFIRICCGLTALYVHLVYTFDLDALIGPHAWMDAHAIEQLRTEYPVQDAPFDWTDPTLDLRPPLPEEQDEVNRYGLQWGTDPRLLYTRGMASWSIWFHVREPVLIGVVHTLLLLVFLLFTVGFFTRVTSVLAWAAAVSYVHRAPATLFGMDAIMMSLLLYLMVAPSGAALSVDRLIEGWRMRRRGESPSPPAPSVGANVIIRMMQIHFCIIYGASGLSKLQGPAWWNGTALWGTMANPEFNPVDLSWYLSMLVLLCRNRWLWEVATTSGAIYTLALEIGFPFLIWSRRWRPWLIIGAVLLHLGIAMIMGLMTFGLIMLSLLASFLPPETVRELVAAIQSGGRTWRSTAAPPVPQEAAA